MSDDRPLRLYPVRPLSDANAMAPVLAGDDGWESPGESHIVPSMVRDGGGEMADVIDADDDSVVQPTPPMPEPLTPSKSTIDTHNLTHWPYRSWCQ